MVEGTQPQDRDPPHREQQNALSFTEVTQVLAERSPASRPRPLPPGSTKLVTVHQWIP